MKPFLAPGRAVAADFFPMFDTPFLYGGPWSREQDEDRAQVAVLSKSVNERLFGGVDSVGRDLELSNLRFRVVGVLDDWKLVPRVYDLTTNPFAPPEDVYIPFHVMVEQDLPNSGNTNCWKPADGSGRDAFLNSECIWIQYWVELRDADEKRAYRDYLDNYVREQKALGRFPRPLNNQLLNGREWLDNQEVVQDEARMLLAVGVMFLAVCLLNTIGLLLSKFLARAPEIGLRRALGATRRTLFAQYMVEAGVIGVAGGVLGLGLTWLGLGGIRRLFGDDVADLVQLDGTLVALAVALAVVSSLLAGLYPTWRACNVAPAAQLKAQ